MTLDQRIEKDLTELYEGKEITCANELQLVLEVSAKGLPQHFVGDGFKPQNQRKIQGLLFPCPT